LLERVRAGESFNELAKEYSQDPGSAAKGGDLDYFTRGVMDKDFEEAAFSLDVGEVSEPVRSLFGYHLLKVEDIRPAKIKPLDEVRDQVKRDTQLQKAELLFYEQANRMANLAYEHSGSLDVVAQDLDLEIKESEFFTRNGGAGVANNADVRSTAFSEDVLIQGLNSDPIELETNHYVVIRLNERLPAQPQALDEVKERIQRELTNTKARELARQAADEIAAQVRDGADPEALAQNSDRLTWKRPGFVGRMPTPEAGLTAPVLKAAFNMNKPEGASPSVDVLAQPNGDAAVVALYGVRAPEATGEQAANPESARSVGQSEYAAFMAETRRNADIEIYLNTQDSP
jgi:peptidyl-prolyl cis-trans isomerase D